MRVRVGRSLPRLVADERGQTVVIVALMFTVLLGFAGLAIDGGRFYAERRFIQNAVDAAALGCVQKLISGGGASAAEDQAKDLLANYNLPGDPTGTGISVSDTPQYTTWFNDQGAGDKRNLADGVVAGTTDCRVAVESQMRTFFLKLFGLATLTIPANAHAKSAGGMLPVVVNRYQDPPGPSDTFIDYTKQEAYQTANPNTCSEDDGGNCPDAAPSDIGCTSGCLWGPETVVAGQGYSSSDSDFRGFIALDVRDFATSAHQYYNGVTSGTGSNALKDTEAAYVVDGYPGPDLEAYVPGSNPVQPGLQIATMAGNSSGIVVTNFDDRFSVGDDILVQLFDGQVREIPDFTLNAPSTIDVTSPSGPANGPSFRVGANQRFRDSSCSSGGACWVDLSMVRDTYDGSSTDTPSAFHDFTFNTDDFTPAGGAGTTVTITNVQVDSGLASGIYSVVIEGVGHDQPVPTGSDRSTHRVYVPINVGGVTRDFSMNFTATEVEAESGQVTYTFTLSTGQGTSSWNGGAVSVALDRGTCSSGNVEIVSSSGATSCATATISPSSATPSKNSPPTVTVTIPSSGLSSGTYFVVLRSRGTNSSSQGVVHVQELQMDVGTSSTGATKYVNVQGYAVFRITSMDANTVLGRAVSGYYADPTDPALITTQKPRLIPWEDSPY